MPPPCAVAAGLLPAVEPVEHLQGLSSRNDASRLPGVFLLCSAERRRSPTRRLWCPLWIRDVIAGFGASALLGHMSRIIKQLGTRQYKKQPGNPTPNDLSTPLPVGHGRISVPDKHGTDKEQSKNNEERPTKGFRQFGSPAHDSALHTPTSDYTGLDSMPPGVTSERSPIRG